jgi:hypothetical protein
LIGANISILHDVLSFGVIPQNGPRNAVKTLIVTAHQEFVESGVAGQHTSDYLLVAPFFVFRLFQQRRAGHHDPPKVLSRKFAEGYTPLSLVLFFKVQPNIGTLVTILISPM